MSEAVLPPPLPSQAPLIDKSLPRPAPTLAYSWREYNPQAKLLYIRDHQHANVELARLGSGPQALGFDLEWKPIFYRGARENPVALVQLANNSTIFLLQLTAMKEFPSKLAEILANPLIVKAGVAVQNDADKICKDWGVSMYNCVDLSLLARTVDNARWQGKYNSSLGLARLIESYEYRLMEKGKITRSNWEAHLNLTQLEYASNDAHAGYILYKKMESMALSLPYSSDSAWYSFNMVSGRFLTSDGLHWNAKNPYYDPGPPPLRKPPRQSADVSHAEGQSSNGPPSNRKTMKNARRPSTSRFQLSTTSCPRPSFETIKNGTFGLWDYGVPVY
ncbi:ribonuclease H-like domain-containing protein [Gymnopilus junonius]|uniref:3'-5' exonuclease n=1 Tax=Gymnopilus junonius TaxID=109634 RepID=A0A9P5NFQ2_GYMJU|nr:ribonuclease H-like domain-containing protein [Gymnopilus junonius]